MNFSELLERYNKLLIENKSLKEENNFLRQKLSLSEKHITCENFSIIDETMLISENLLHEKPDNSFSKTVLNDHSSPEEKIKLFMSLFRGRNDVYAKRWESKKGNRTGYSPVCANEWEFSICKKPVLTCNKCSNKKYVRYDENTIDRHLRGINGFVAGIYPLCEDETCYLLAMDFDEKGWKEDIMALREVCGEFDIALNVERSRSGKGAHIWFFFESAVPASTARKFGSAILTYSMNKRHEIKFESYDRLFPSQDTLAKGGLGNLIALPLQKEARKKGNSVFIDENFRPFEDQWHYLSSVKKFSSSEINHKISQLCSGHELGMLKTTDEDKIKPWEICTEIKLSGPDFPDNIKIIRANMIHIEKKGLSQKALNYIKRLAAFKNPEFYKAQAMRLPTFNKARIISCSEETKDYISLPRGNEPDLICLLQKINIKYEIIDKTNRGRPISVEFIGSLRDEQPMALSRLLMHDNGVLCGTTAFGKTVVAISLIAERKVNTLVLVDKVSLAEQWRKKVPQFLKIKEEKKGGGNIGQLGAGKNELKGIIDIAIIQSLNRLGEIKDCIRDYGMIIVDECHHVSAVTFENVLKKANAKYVYGLSATPKRKDGQELIIFMQCGKIRYRDDAKKQAERRPFEHYVIPVFTKFRVPMFKDDASIHELYSEMVNDEIRNQIIIDDFINSYESGRNCILLTQRTAHVKWFEENLKEKIPNIISLTGSKAKREKFESMRSLCETPANRNIAIVATGKYIGEGFDEPRLDTLFLAMPISWKGTLEQYAGRLHRLCENKKEVQIFDYVDIHVKMFEKMYQKRLSGYASIGYKAKGEGNDQDIENIIFNRSNFLPVYTGDILKGQREILIVSPFISKTRLNKMIQYLEDAVKSRLRVIVVTRPPSDFNDNDRQILSQLNEDIIDLGIELLYRSKIHQKFSIIDNRIVWYGSINLLSYGKSEESIMRLKNSSIAFELYKSIGI